MTQETSNQSGTPTGMFTGRKRRTTRKSVRVIDEIMRWIITAGGIGVVVAFATIVVFIVYVVKPMFNEPDIEQRVSVNLPVAASSTTTQPSAKPLAMEVDEHLANVWILDESGMVSSFVASTGELVATQSASDQSITAFSNNRGEIAIGRADGKARVGRIMQATDFVSTIPDAMESLEVGQAMVYDNGVATLTPGGQLRVIKIKLNLSDPVAIGPDPASPIRLIDYLFTDRLEAIASVREDGRIFFSSITKKMNVMTGKEKVTARDYELPQPESRAGVMPKGVFLGLNGRLVFLLYHDGHIIRYNTDNPNSAFVAEELDLLPDQDVDVVLASVRMLLGNLTLIVTDSKGGVTGWFPAPSPIGKTRDDLRMVRAHELHEQPSTVTAIATSSRDRQFITADDRGNVLLRHMTSGTTQKELRLDGEPNIVCVAMSPKNDAIVTLDENRSLTIFSMHNPHADGSMRAMFAKIHYEGYADAQHVYQSSAGTDDAEPKYGLMPLIFGTLKATLYAMLFAVPIAIMAAIYSSEFMQPQVRAVVKPLVELMASLPSVVLGFIGAIVFAPFVESVVPAVLLTFVAIPLGVAGFGFLFQVLPPAVVRAVPLWTRFLMMIVLVLLAVLMSFALGPFIAWLLFAPDYSLPFASKYFTDWLGGSGNATPGWIVLLTPTFIIALTFGINLWVKPRVSLYQHQSNRVLLIAMDLGRFLITFAVAIGLAVALGAVFNAAGFDLRGNIAGPYVQRNSMIVGMLMGFAIIPIIYTVSEDSLSSVPGTLRSAALGAGATPWQTAIRVILPVAASGIFSACMIGFGRAAGETMIVLMASGRTPIIDLNIFNGLSALSANVATELPEAPVNSTHYRMLFLSALVLFVITFAVNTTAEVIRIRFRKRAYQL